jgi:hypothetical protein
VIDPMKVYALPILVAMTVATGCNVVDESDISESDPAVVDSCDVDAPPISPRPAPRTMDFLTLTNRSQPASGCGLLDVNGNDGHFMVQGTLGEELFVEATPLDPSVDVAVYLSPQCDSVCSGARDRCGVGEREAFSFIVPPSTEGTPDALQTFGLVVDTHEPYAGLMEVVYARIIPNNNIRERGEACDIGQTASAQAVEPATGTTCVRGGIAADVQLGEFREQEPNDRTSIANYANLPGSPDDRAGAASTVTLRGQIGGCDTDVIAFNVPAATVITARQTGASGVTVRLFQADEASLRPFRLESGQDGATLSSVADVAGRWFVEIFTNDTTAMAADYSIRVDFAARL